MSEGIFKRGGISLLLLLSIVFTVYSNTVQNSFHFDDYHSIVNNPYIRHPENIPSFFTSPDMFSVDRNARMWRPLLLLTYTLNYRLGGYDVFGYHLVNITLHALNVILLYLILFHLMPGQKVDGFYRWLPFLPALVFGVHAINTQAVNYISSRSVLLVTLFYLLAFYGYIKGTRKGYLLSILAYILALLSKEIGFTLPLVLIIYDLLIERRLRLIRYIPFLGVAGWYLFLRKILFGVPVVEVSYRTIVKGEGMARSIYTNILTQIKALVFYMGKLILPVNLNVDHYFPVVLSPAEPSFIGSLMVVVSLFVVALWIRRNNPIISFGILWFFTAFLPEIILPLNMVINEHRTYLPGIGFSMVVAGLGLLVVERYEYNELPKYLSISLCALLTGFMGFNAFNTYQRNFVWKDEYSLWRDTLEKNPLSFHANLEMGKYYLEKGNYKRATIFGKKLMALAPYHPSTQHLLGLIYVKTGEIKKGIQFLKRAIALRPSAPNAYVDLAFVYMDLGEENSAIAVFNKVVNINPYDDKAHYNLGYLYMKRGDLQRAEEHLLKSIRINPSNYSAFYNLGGIYLIKGRLKRAETSFRRALSLNKKDPALLFNLGLVYEKMGKKEEAERFFKRALGK